MALLLTKWPNIRLKNARKQTVQGEKEVGLQAIDQIDSDRPVE
jgi:hypothetical protein